MSNTLFAWEFSIASSIGLVVAFGLNGSPEEPPDVGWVLRGVRPDAEVVSVESVKCLGAIDRSLPRCMPSPASLRAPAKPLPRPT